MKKPNSLTIHDLNNAIANLPTITNNIKSKPKEWKRVDVGQTEVYLGDNLFVVALVENLPASYEEMSQNQVNTEIVVTKYLKSEGFIGEKYAYVGMQKLNLKNLPDNFNFEEGFFPEE
jgi:hypothetical protein